ncbi:MAG: amidase, partial [Rhodospirillaceae bacterium]|nr:amidase [Rhodospirillaceae bacterium]
MSDPTDLSIAEIGRKLRERSLKARDLAEAAIANHEKRGDPLAAYKLWQADAARDAADAADALFASGTDLGPFQGVPISVKDLFAVNGLPTFSGTPNRLPEAFEREGPVVGALRGQQAVITGKTHTVEFAYGGVGVNNHWGSPRNPWDAKAHRVSGGSSSGAGVSLCEGSALIALGSDTAGSVRVPASVTGNVGLKITHGRWPLAGITPLSPALDTPGVLARTVADTAIAFGEIDRKASTPALLAAMEATSLDGLRIGVCDDLFWQDCSPGVVEGVRAALDELVAAGARIVPLELPEAEEVFGLFRRGGIVSAEFKAFLEDELPDWEKTLDSVVSARMENAADISAIEFVRRCRLMARCSATAAARLRAVDCVVTPTVAITPPKLEEVSDVEGYKPRNMMMLRNTSIGNLLSLCALTLPVALDTAGMPMGLQILMSGGAEERLFAVGSAAERT